MPTNTRSKVENSGVRRPVIESGWAFLIVLIGITIVTGIAAIRSVSNSGVALAASPGNLAQAATPTGATDETAPLPVSSPQEDVPIAEPTNGLSPIPTGEAQIGGSTNNTTGGVNAGDNTAPSSSGSGGFPWVIVALVAIVVVVGLGFAAMRQRRPATATEPGMAQPPMRSGTDLRNLSASAPTSGAVAQGMVSCPNCGTSNSNTEKFCRECGQDLRAAKAQSATAGAASSVPPSSVELVGANTPYLETLDRVDEQLEFVLARPQVRIGTAAGNDIVIDASFNGWETVSPQHAELKREQDGGFVIADRESEQGTFVNEMRTGENILSSGDLIRLGKVRFVFRIPGSGG